MINLNRYIFGLLSFRVIILIICSFYALSGPHEWRQYDTLGMGIRYFIEFFQSPLQKYPGFLPAVLQAGDSLGITPVEIPILNLMIAPLFFFGETAGLAFSRLLLLVINIQLLYFNYKLWREQEIAGEKTGEAFLLLPLLGFFGLFFGKFIPDILSVQLTLCALGLALKHEKFLAPILIGSLGLLIKPTSVIVYALFLLMQQRKIIRHYFWMGLTILITIAYYKLVNPAILSFAGEKSVFAVGTKPLAVAIQQVLEKPLLFLTIFLKALFSNWMIIPFLLIIIYQLIKKQNQVRNLLSILAIIFLQWAFLHLLSGDHPYWHNYYYLGISPLVVLLFYRVLIKGEKWQQQALVGILLIVNILQATYDMKPIIKPSKKRAWQIAEECQSLKRKAKDFPWDRGYHFRSPREYFPILGVCFGEVQNATNTQYGFFYRDEKFPHDCQEKFSSKNIILAACPK